MTKRIPKFHNEEKLIEAIGKLPNPMYDKKHDIYIYIEGQARSNQTRVEHIADYSHELKVRDIELIPEGIKNYIVYKKDPFYKDTFNYYLKRKGQDRGLIKVSIQISSDDIHYAWIKTIFITYSIK